VKYVAVIAHSFEAFRHGVMPMIGTTTSVNFTRGRFETPTTRYFHVRSMRDLRGYSLDALMLLPGYHLLSGWQELLDLARYQLR
jgi:hypothetical protein